MNYSTTQQEPIEIDEPTNELSQEVITAPTPENAYSSQGTNDPHQEIVTHPAPECVHSIQETVNISLIEDDAHPVVASESVHSSQVLNSRPQNDRQVLNSRLQDDRQVLNSRSQDDRQVLNSRLQDDNHPLSENVHSENYSNVLSDVTNEGIISDVASKTKPRNDNSRLEQSGSTNENSISNVISPCIKPQPRKALLTTDSIKKCIIELSSRMNTPSYLLCTYF